VHKRPASKDLRPSCNVVSAIRNVVSLVDGLRNVVCLRVDRNVVCLRVVRNVVAQSVLPLVSPSP